MEELQQKTGARKQHLLTGVYPVPRERNQNIGNTHTELCVLPPECDEIVTWGVASRRVVMRQRSVPLGIALLAQEEERQEPHAVVARGNRGPGRVL
jgi:hypothetical protein